jgi:hypothetical protein
VKIMVRASVTAQLGDGGSSTIGTRRMRRTRSIRDPPVAATAITGDTVRHDSSSASARAYSTASPQISTAISSQLCSRSARTRFESHHTAGW